MVGGEKEEEKVLVATSLLKSESGEKLYDYMSQCLF